eukprot:390577-Lingulodinium_polyedra.AAC.1
MPYHATCHAMPCTYMPYHAGVAWRWRGVPWVAWLCMAVHGCAWHGMAWHGMACHGMARRGV